MSDGRHCGFRGPGFLYGLKDRFTAKGLGLALDKPLIHVPTLTPSLQPVRGRALDLPYHGCQEKPRSIRGVYRFQEEFEILREQDAMDMGELLEVLNGLGEPVIFLGDRCLFLKAESGKGSQFLFLLRPM